ncbi:MAG: OmpH family outer membrane protein [Phycisphaeraceae bacterium]
MVQRFIMVAMLAATLGLAGCGDGSPSANASNDAAGTGKVGVIDLDKVAKAMGWEKELQQALGAADQELGLKVAALRNSLAQTLQTERQKMGDKLTKEQEAQVQQMAAVANNQYNQAFAQAKQELQRVRDTAVRQYRDVIQPYARNVASEHGMTLVLVPLDNVVWYDSSVDITDPVVDRMLKEKPASPPIPTIRTPEPLPTTQPAP